MSTPSAQAILPFPAAESPSPSSSVFLKLLSLLGGDAVEETPEQAVESSPVQAANPKEIADAVIRSMFRSGASAIATPVAQTVSTDISLKAESSKGAPSTETAAPAAEETAGADVLPNALAIAGGAKTEIVPTLSAPRERQEAPKGKESRSRSVNAQTENLVSTPAQAAPPVSTQKVSTPPATDNSQPQLATPVSSPEVTTSGRESSPAPLAFALRLTPRETQGSTDLANQADQNFSIAPRESKQDSSSNAPSSGSGGEQTKEDSRRPRVNEFIAVAESPSVSVASLATLAPVAAGSGHIETTPQRHNVEIPANPSAEAPIDLAPQTPKASSAHEIAVRVSAPDQSSVDLHIAQRGGEVRVAVRTADSGLQTSLHNDLGTLVGRLDRAGFHTETITAVESSAAGRMDAGLDRSNGAAHFAIHATETLREFSSNDSGSHGGSSNSNADERGANHGSFGGRQQQQHHHRRQNAGPEARWRQTLEETL